NELANLDRLVALGEKVDATGIPVVNRWINAGRKELAGDTDVTNFNAQLEITIPGLARILAGNPNLTGVTSNRAREEMRAIVDKGFTAEMLHSVAPLIEADLATRVGSIQDQINIINARIRGEPVPTLKAPGAREPRRGPELPAAAPAEVPTKTINGKTYYDYDGEWHLEPPPARGGEGARPF